VDPRELDVPGEEDLPAEERARRARAIREHVRAQSLAEWSEAQLADLDRCAAGVS
jgi:hypothetical protein